MQSRLDSKQTIQFRVDSELSIQFILDIKLFMSQDYIVSIQSIQYICNASCALNCLYSLLDCSQSEIRSL